nr:hypothetical protein [Bacteroidota bacterium]
MFAIVKELAEEKVVTTSIASISKAVLSELEISVPSIQKQELILNIYKLRNREKRIKEQLETLREKEIQHQILTAIK